MSVLSDELANDPETRGYATMSTEEKRADLYTAWVKKNKTSMTASEVANAIDIGQWNALSPDDQRKIWDVLHMGTINPFGIEATIFIAVFGAGSATITALQAARVEFITRVADLGLGYVSLGDFG